MLKLKSFLLSLLIVVSSISNSFIPLQASSTQDVIIHYQRSTQDYLGWNLWVWFEGKDGQSYDFTGTDSYGVSSSFTIDSTVKKIGLIVRLNNFEEKDITEDRFVELNGTKTELWLVQGDATIYTTKPNTTKVPVITPSTSGTLDLTVHYKRYDNVYTGWNVWLWLEGKNGLASNFSSKDDYGVVLRKSIKLDAQDKRLGIIIRLNEWQAKDIDVDRFIDLSKAVNGKLDIYLLQGDEKLYYTMADIDFSPRFLSANCDAIDMISVQTTLPLDLIHGNVLEKIKLTNSKHEDIALKQFYAKEGVGVTSSSNFSLFTLKPIDLSESYTLSYPGYAPIPVKFRSVFNSVAFENQFTTDEELGSIYTTESTLFKLWAPTASHVTLNLFKTGNTSEVYLINQTSSFDLSRSQNGVWSIKLVGDLSNVYYTYTVTVNGVSQEAVDPYAKAVGVNGLRAMVVDLDSTDPAQWEDDNYVSLKSSTDAILYELHIRDFSSDLSSGILEDYQGKFLAFTQKDTKNSNGFSTGIQYLKELGITHVHILPSFDYRSIDETQLDKNTFNWGYDPQNFNVPEGSYSTNPFDGAVRINEFKQMVMALHEAGIGVIMDVVYNHTGASNDSDFSKIVPGYYYRYNPNGTFSNGSGTGNETASDRSMVAQFMLDSTEYWVKEYHIDGFRFDLMALHDIETMNRIESNLRLINPSILLYGEGWTGGSSTLPDAEKALKRNVSQLNNIAVFSDDIRDAIKGHVFTPTDPGFVNGGLGLEESIKFGIVASIQHPDIDMNLVKYTKFSYATSPTQIISYVEAHDNLTLWDKLLITNPDASEQELIAMHRMANAIVLTSQGTSFIHAGSEFLRTKQGNDNSYNVSDEINRLDWDRREQYDQNVEYIKGLIELRKEHPAFRMSSADDIRSNLDFIDTNQANVVAYTLSNHANKDPWESILVIMNANTTPVEVTVDQSHWNVVVDGQNAGVKSIDSYSSGTITVAASTLLVLVDQKSIDPLGYYLPYLGILLALGIVGFYFYNRKKSLSLK